MQPIYETFAGSDSLRWNTQITGDGQLEATAGSLKFSTNGASRDSYSNAQIDDYQGLPRHRFAWHPPLRLTVRARFSHTANELRGTAGFGFWNDPLLMTQKRLPALPRAIWFFYSSAPSDMRLCIGVPGHGWKAATIDTKRVTTLVWAPLAPLLVPLMNIAPLYRGIWPRIQRDLRIHEAVVPVDMRQWHTYELHWGTEQSQFRVIGEGAEPGARFSVAPSPRGPLGFVMWQDNQYLVVTPWGRIRWGLLEAPERQSMEIDYFSIAPAKDMDTREAD